MRPKISDPYVPRVYANLSSIGTSGVAASSWPAANRAIYVPIIFPQACQLYSLSFIAGNGTGNYDLGWYDGYSKTKQASTGTTAMTAAGAKTLSFSPDYRVDPGKLYYAALALSSGSGSTNRNNSAISALIGVGCAQEALSALPLNTTMTPATVTSAYVPLFVFGIR